VIPFLPAVSPHLSQMVHFALHRDVCRELQVSELSPADRSKTLWALGRDAVDKAVRTVLARSDVREVVWKLSPLPLEGTAAHAEMGAEVVQSYLDELIEAFCWQMAGAIWLASCEVSMTMAAGGPDYQGSSRRESEVTMWLDAMKESGSLLPPGVSMPSGL
jgi:hypothetical protein